MNSPASTASHLSASSGVTSTPTSRAARGVGDDIIESGSDVQRFADARRGKGKRGGLRVLYYWWVAGFQFWLFTLYDKDEMADLTPQQRKALKAMIKAELEARRKS